MERQGTHKKVKVIAFISLFFFNKNVLTMGVPLLRHIPQGTPSPSLGQGHRNHLPRLGHSCGVLCCQQVIVSTAPSGKAGRKLLCGGGGGGVTRKPIFPTPPSLLGRRDGTGGFRAGAPDLPCRRGGGSTQHLWLKMIPTSC